MTVTPEHDGRIIADIVAEWATLHTEPFEQDAVEFCRVLCGRGVRHPDSVLRHALPL